MFFFSKQKTAYCMRISDWSSDVCSSDLAQHAFRRVHGDARRGGRAARFLGVLRGTGVVGDRSRRRRARAAPAGGERALCADRRVCRPSGARKSVVSGKSESVRADIGGRGILEKKKNKNESSSKTN